MPVRSPRPRVTLIGVAVVSALLFAACGGGGGSAKASNATVPDNNGTGGAVGTTEAHGSSTNTKCYTTPGTQTARVRFVNLFTNATYPQGDIDVWQGYGASDGCGKKLATIPYGTASDYIDVTAADADGNWSATGYVPGGADQDHQIIQQTETWKGGEQVTIVFTPGDPSAGQPAHSGSVSAIFEKDTGDATSEATFAPAAGQGVLGVSANALQYVDTEGSWIGGIAGQTACLLGPGDSETSRTNVGGTSLIAYPVPPGPVDFGLFASIPGQCTGTPAMGPVTIDTAAGARTLVFAYGPDQQNERLLVLPVDN